jgi:hypothetical protein
LRRCAAETLVSSLSGAGPRGCVPDGERFPCLTFLFIDPLGPDPLIPSFERHLYAENRSARTSSPISSASGRRCLPARAWHQPEAATRANLEAFIADLLARRTASTAAATSHKILYGWLAEEEEIPTKHSPAGPRHMAEPT